jgi:hypothetical protein
MGSLSVSIELCVHHFVRPRARGCGGGKRCCEGCGGVWGGGLVSVRYFRITGYAS